MSITGFHRLGEAVNRDFYRLGKLGIKKSAVSIDWLLLDRYLTDLAAGNVDGTAAEPGPGTREASASVSIASAELVVPATNGAGFEDTLTRAAGVTFLFTKADALTSGIMNGLDNAADFQGGYSGVMYFHITKIKNKNSGGKQILQAAASDGARFAVIARVTGFFFLYANNGVTWQLLDVQRVGADATLYAGFYSFAGTHNRDDCGVVQLSIIDPALYPIPAVSDSFNRANGALGSTDGKGHPEGAVTPQGNGIAWENASTWTVSSNTATNTPVGAADNLCYAVSGKSEVYQAAKITRSGGEVGIVINAADTDNYLRVVHDGTNVITTEVVAGTPNVLSTVAAAYSAAKYIEARRIGNDVYIFYNGAYIANVTPNVALQNNTKHGNYDDTGNVIDDVVTWPTTGYNYGAYA